MTTNAVLISDTLKLLGVIGISQTASSAQGSHALRVLNQMMETWDEDGIKLGWFEQTTTVDDAPIPKWAEKGVISKLAQALSATYPASSMQPWVYDDTQNGYDTILRIHVQPEAADMSHMPLGYGSGSFDINNG
jgi:hypothetical protein